MKKAKSVLLLLAFAHAAFAAEVPITIWLPESQETLLALEAGPEHLRAQATVYVFDRNGYRKTRTGDNGFTCFVNRDGNQNRDNNLKPTCWDAEGTRTIVPIMLHVGEQIARGAPAEEIKRSVEMGFSAGRFESPKRAGIAYMLRGDLQFDPIKGTITKELFPPHYMFYAPGATNADIGITVRNPESKFSLPSVFDGYSGGGRTAYIIVLAAPRGGHAHSQ